MNMTRGEHNEALDPISSIAEQSLESAADEADIMSDKDLTLNSDPSANEPSRNRMSGSVEDEPEAFARGDVDVVTQMNRTRRAMEDEFNGHTVRNRNEDDRVPNA